MPEKGGLGVCPGTRRKGSALHHLLVKDHCEAYLFWKQHGFQGATCVHVDAHLDVAELPEGRTERGSTYIPGLGLNCGNYLTPALREGIVTHLVCVLPDFMELSLVAGQRELQSWADLSLSEYRSLEWRDGRVEGVLKGRRITLCRAENLPELGRPLLLDIDLDYFVNDAREIWRRPEDLNLALEPDALTVAYSVEGGYLPPEATWMGPAVLKAYGIDHPGLEVPESPLDRGSALFRLGHVAEALAELARVDSPESRYLQGMIAYRRGNFDRAAELLEQPFMRGAALYRAERYVEAVQALQQAIKSNPTPDALHLFGMAWVGAGRPDQGARWLQTALRQAPDRLAAQILKHELGLPTEIEPAGLRRRVPP